MKLKNNKRGQIMMYINFIILAVIIITIAAVAAPMGVLFNTKMYAAGEDIILRANESIADINDDEVRTQIYDVLREGLNEVENNIEVNNDIFKYSWIIVLGLTALIMFITTRTLVEYNQGGFI